MATRRLKISVSDINSAKALAAEAGRSPRDRDDWADVESPGLIMRAEGRSVRWLLKYKGKTRSLGRVDDFSPKIAREVAGGVRKLLDLDVDPAPYVAARKLGVKEEDAIQAAREAAVPPEKMGWQWRELADAYLTEHISVQKGNRPPSEKTIADVRSLWRNAGFSSINEKYLRDLTRGDLERVRDYILRHSGGRRSNMAVSYMKAALTWAYEKHHGASGLEGKDPWWVFVRPLHDEKAARASKRRTRFVDGEIVEERNCLSIEQVGRLLALAETHRKAGRRSVAHGVYYGLWWIALTGQRKTAGTGLRVDRVGRDREVPGWKMAFFPAAEMKGKRDHLLPLPPALYEILQQAREEEEAWIDSAKNQEGYSASKYFFPAATRKSRKTGLPHDIPISESAINQWIRRMRGIGKNGESVDVDLLDGLPDFTLHSLRASLNTALLDAGYPGQYGSAILGHAMPDADDRASRRNPTSATGGALITQQVYDESQYLSWKREGLKFWVDAVLSAYETAKLELAEDAIMERHVA